MSSAKHLPGFEARIFDFDGVPLRYYVGGAGPPIVLAHGLGGAASNWSELAPLLARRRRVLAPDLPGHGGSSPLPAVPNLNPFADAVAALAACERMVPAPVVGHSMGGVVALRLAIRRPEVVTAVVLAGAAGIRSATRRAEAVLELVLGLRPARLASPHRARIARSAFLRHLVLGLEVSDPLALPGRSVDAFLCWPGLHADVESAARALVRDDPRSELDRLRCPALVLWGARDRLAPLEDGFEYARRLGARLRVVPDCGHLIIGERPDACLDAIESFLGEL